MKTGEGNENGCKGKKQKPGGGKDCVTPGSYVRWLIDAPAGAAFRRAVVIMAAIYNWAATMPAIPDTGEEEEEDKKNNDPYPPDMVEELQEEEKKKQYTTPAIIKWWSAMPGCVREHSSSREEPRFEVCYQLRSTKHLHRVRIKTAVPEKNPKVPSLAALWPGFNWQERETYDMYGIQFDGHPDLRRIYLYEEFEGYPLRKDYPKLKRQPLVRRDDLE